MVTYWAWLALSLCFACVGTVFALLVRIRRTVVDISAAQARVRKAADLADELQLAMERLDGVERSLKRLHSRAGMRELRERRANGGGGAPDWRDDPEGYRQHMERELGITRTGRPT